MVWRVGDTVGPYKLTAQLGQGGMATVFKGYHNRLERDVAIKVMHQNFLEDESFVVRFKREAQIVARLEHPHIVPIYDYSEHNGLPYLVMKYIEGETLKAALQRESITLLQILHVMTAMASALDYAHGEGVLHRDIKPSNIVIDKYNTPYLADFGLARIAAAGQSTLSADMLLGTPHYISPEQARGHQGVDGRTDIYALGIVLYEMLVGQVPFNNDSPFAIIHDHIYTPLPLPSTVNPEIPPAVEEVLVQAVAKSPQDRYATAGEFVQDFRDAIEESGLLQLSPERASLAAQSLALLRATQAEQFTQTQGSSTRLLPDTSIAKTPVGIAAPGAGYRTGTVVAVQTRPGERFWPISGCGAFLVISLISIAILLSAWNSFSEFVSLLQGDQVVISFNIGGPPGGPGGPPRTVVLEDYTLTYDTADVPVLGLAEAQQNILGSTNPLAYLALARTQLSLGEQQAAEQTIQRGAQFVDPNRLPDYMMNAAVIADETGHYASATAFALLAYELALNTPAFEDISAAATQYLYTVARRVNNLDMGRTMRNLIVNLPNTDNARLRDMATSEVAMLALASSRLANGNTDEARQLLNRISSTGQLQAETALLRAELSLMAGDTQAGVLQLRTLAADDTAPAWVQDVAGALADQIEEAR